MEINYKITEEDFVSQNLFAWRHIPRISKKILYRRIFFYILLLLIILQTFFSYYEYGNIISLCFGLFMLIILLSYTRINLFSFKRSIRQRYRSLDTSNFTINLCFDKDELTVADGKGKTSIKTQDLLTFFETNGFFIIQLDREQFLFIPKNQLQEVIDFRQELKELSREYSIPYKEKPDWTENIYSRKSLIS